MVGAYGISGMAQWALGFEDPGQWQPLRDYAGLAPAPGRDRPHGGRRGRGGRGRPGHRRRLGPRSRVGPADPRWPSRRPQAGGLPGQRRPPPTSPQSYPGPGRSTASGTGSPRPQRPQSAVRQALGVGAGARTTSLGCGRSPSPEPSSVTENSHLLGKSEPGDRRQAIGSTSSGEIRPCKAEPGEPAHATLRLASGAVSLRGPLHPGDGARDVDGIEDHRDHPALLGAAQVAALVVDEDDVPGSGSPRAVSAAS